MPRKANKGPVMSDWFRRVFKDHPDWLRLDNNTPIRDLWKEEHGSAMPLNVANIMTNVKGQMRGTRRRKGAKPGPKPAGTARPARLAVIELERLEAMIDDCLAAARAMNVEDIHEVVSSLRDARNGIVRMFVKKD